MNTVDWYGLYTESWQNEIVPEAFSHPAKFSRGLIRRIYQHLLVNGYVKPGDRVVDCFGGVALGGLDAMMYGLDWQGCELEEKFVELGRANIALWSERYGRHFSQWGTAVLHQGDSRQLVKVLQTAGAVVSSPPYIDSVNKLSNGIDTNKFAGRDKLRDFGDGNSNIETSMQYGRTEGQLGSMPEGDYSAVVSSPPFGEGEIRNRSPYQGGYIADMMSRAYTQDKQGTTAGNLATMKAHGQDFTAVISSPPYADAVSGQGEGPGARHDPIYHNGDNAFKKSSQAAYGDTAGNLGNMPVVNGVVSSPPYEGSIDHAPGNKNWVGAMPGNIKDNPFYGHANGQIGIVSGETFWAASRLIVEQCRTILKPGGVAVWVTGDFVRNKQRVFFGRQWLQLCESLGFVEVEWIRAWKVRPGAKQLAIDGNHHDHTTEQISFFRRMSNAKNPGAAVRNEDVIIMVKP